MRKKGSRPITVDGTPFRWRIRLHPTYCQEMAWAPLTVAVEPESGGSVVVLVFDKYRPDGLPTDEVSIATPALVASGIRGAISAGWDMNGSGGPMFFGVTNGRLASSELGARD